MNNVATANLSLENKNTFFINLLLGGFSIFVMLACWVFIDKSTSLFTISQFAMSAAFIANHPHFTSSYMLLYTDFRKNITKNLRYFWAAVLAPLILGAYLFYCLFAERSDLLGFSINAMFFLVGWHYVKQIFGVVIVTSAFKKYYYTQNERYVILANLFSIWAISFFNSQTYAGSFDFYGIKYESFAINVIWLNLSYAFFAATLVYVIALHVKKYIVSGILPASSAVVAMVALYAWYLPLFSHPHFAYLIPFFHSAQYLVFVWYFKRNQIAASLPATKGPSQRQVWVTQVFGYFATALILGALFFEFLPKALDSYFKFNNAEMGPNPVLVAFLLFINIHHYFIDNVIWKSSNPEIKKYLQFEPKN